MNHITTIAQLTQILDQASPAECSKIMKRIRIDTSELEHCATWSDQSYTRNCLARNKKYELILLCWDIGAKTPIHDHGGKDCWVYQIQGTIQETRYQAFNLRLKETHQMTLSAQKLTYMNDSMGYHALENIANQRAMTLHIYVSPIDVCEVFNTQKGCFETKKMSYHTHQEKNTSMLVS
ncbi:cysteine dioxygenase family protein [Aureispira sp. CCB-E]|uniref:cysteine dioxygenase n=1 Tax=Aureispira sp. CCB-E TaxID=3051121 RepID=UPI00286977BB|nr:cysteine dioxygenase family protein [Aureispira sp. CCB-E]WMX12330.1 cysteine dioxygenase family protein [Aureispira sp. CCB-E]